jgi:hypothetical protein
MDMQERAYWNGFPEDGTVSSSGCFGGRVLQWTNVSSIQIPMRITSINV